MRDFVELVGPNQALAVFGVKLVGANAENAKKLLFTLVFVCLCLLLVKGLRLVSRRMFHRGSDQRIEFWVRQGINLVAAVLLLFGTMCFEGYRGLRVTEGNAKGGFHDSIRRVAV